MEAAIDQKVKTTHDKQLNVLTDKDCKRDNSIGEIDSNGFQTKSIHAGINPDQNMGAIVTPIHQSTIFKFKALGEPAEFEYSRCGNPTRKALEDNLAALEGGVFCTALATGQAAELTLLSLFKNGDHILCGNDVYGGTIRLFNHLKEHAGIQISYISMTNPENVVPAIQPNTKALWIETPSNPLFNTIDIKAMVDIAHSFNLVTIVDNTLLTPYYQQPIKFGADFVIHSATKYLSGHNDGLGGAIICRDEMYIEQVSFTANALGAVLGAFDSWLILRGIKTLALRLREQQKSTQQIARFLQEHPEVTKVYYPGLEDHPQFDLIRKQTAGYGAMLSFEIKEGIEMARRILNKVKLFFIAESFGGVESLIQHPQTMSHSSLSPEAQQNAGITENLIRISVGLEDVQDLLEDLEQALEV